MKFERSREWWASRIDREGDEPVSAGLMAFDPRPAPEDEIAAEESRLAFGRFVHLMRRRQGLTVEDLARRADLETADLLVIEDNLRFTPEPRTVYQLARYFKVSQQRLMQLAGLTMRSDMVLREQAVRFAARSESVQALTREEMAALNEFVSVLGKQEPGSKP